MPHERIEMNPDIMGGKPVVRGTRVPVELILRKLGAGMSPESIIVNHPRLTHDDIHAAQDLPPGSHKACSCEAHVRSIPTREA
jgi:uncharacterized protein (DUF433 family)